jgi:hypothetical protein
VPMGSNNLGATVTRWLPAPRRSHAVNGSLISEREALDRPKLRRQQLCIAAANAENHKRTGIANDSRADRVAELIGVLVREREVGRKLTSLAEERGEGFRAEGLELVDMYEERDALLGRDSCPPHRDELKVRDEK